MLHDRIFAKNIFQFNTKNLRVRVLAYALNTRGPQIGDLIITDYNHTEDNVASHVHIKIFTSKEVGIKQRTDEFACFYEDVFFETKRLRFTI